MKANGPPPHFGRFSSSGFWKLVVLWWGILGCAEFSAFGDDTPKSADPPELVSRRTDYQRAVDRAQITLITNYLRTLEPLKQQFTRDGKLGAALAVDKEIALAKEQLAAAETGADINANAMAAVQINSVFWGDPASKRMRDVTRFVRSAYQSGASGIVLGGDAIGGGDPAPFVAKVAVVTFTVNGKRKEKTFKSDYSLNFAQDLK